MDGHEPRKNSVDYISNLPADLKEKILVKLSIKEAVKTSILSSKWKDSWTSISNLVFEEKSTESRLTNLVDMVLLVHQGPIREFKLVSEHACNGAIGRWMLVLSTNGIEYLDLKFKVGETCEVPSRFFSCTALKSVHLSGCIINFPWFFNGFTLLHTLWLSRFDLSGFGIEKLVSSCPLLDYLSLLFFFQPGCLNISAPSLTKLNICGEFYDLCLDTPKLTFASIELLTDNNGDYRNFNAAKDGKESNITRAVGRLSNIQKLVIISAFADHLAMGPIPVKLPTIFNHLKEIYLQVDTSKQNADAALCLFQNAPNIEVLDIELQENEVEDELHVQALWELKVIKDCLFKHLKIVNMNCGEFSVLSLRSAKSMLEFAKFVLSTASALEKLSIIGLEEDIIELFYEKFDNFTKLSMKAEIVFNTFEEFYSE